MQQVEGEAAEFFDEFVVAFASFDGAEIAQRYVVPYVAMHADGSMECFAEPAHIAAYFQRVVDAYGAKGCRSCRYKEMAVVPLGQRCLLATVTWELLYEDQTVLGVWRESYNLCRMGRAWKIFASTDHVA